MNIIEVKSLYKSYMEDEVAKVQVLKGVNVNIKQGEFVAILGPSGSGKSTFLNMIGGMDLPDKGQIIIDTMDITKLNDNNLSDFRLHKIGFIFQFFNLIPMLTAKENISLPSEVKNKKKDIEYINMLIAKLGLKDRENHYPAQLSGGEQQRVAIARALVNKPRIILADEPTGNLDSKNSKAVIKLLKEISEEMKLTIILITHDKEIASYADRILNMMDGVLYE
ncbi:MAG: ABC transporter ATP-binding protein [Clostridium sulfidigenes]|uniref:ABC transporter ATP-binding protein n=1 Tax=Clostridium sulfidigenes TaxID=318464 RepID=A0A927ZS54_9CLOT|nr:ABC transporter ATP-binding protein [Clostridium sulfidigenes]